MKEQTTKRGKLSGHARNEEKLFSYLVVRTNDHKAESTGLVTGRTDDW